MKDDYIDSYAYKREQKEKQRFLELINLLLDLDKPQNRSFEIINPELYKFLKSLKIEKIEDVTVPVIDKIKYLYTLNLRHHRQYYDLTTFYTTLFIELLDSDIELLHKGDEAVENRKKATQKFKNRKKVTEEKII